MKMNWKLKIALPVIITLLTVAGAKAQDNEKVIIRGIVFCEDSLMGTLPDVAVYNISRRTGTITDGIGAFSIQIGRKDTLVFSTVQHKDELFYFKEGEPFEDKVISIPMKMDVIWIDVVSVMGKGNYEAFKSELMNMEIPDNNPSMALPVVNKYAEEYSTGEAAIKIRGPLTHLSNKIRKWKKRRVINPVEE
tara:strand:- start:117 stop:692 length:576 start_codon:yes stop_codon:yes gene_type:complete